MNRFVWTPRPGLFDVVQTEGVAAIPDKRFDQDDRREMIAALFFVAVHWQLSGEDLWCYVESIHTENLEFRFRRFSWNVQILMVLGWIRSASPSRLYSAEAGTRAAVE